MLGLYIANKNYSSWSLRPWLLMKQLNIPFTEHVMPFGTGSNWEEFRRFSPSGKVPCLRTNDGIVWDSLAIAEFLAEHYAAVWPRDSAARAWARCASAEMHAGFATLREHCSMNCAVAIELHNITPALQADINRIEELWCEGLQKFGGPFLAGSEFSAVDAFFCPVAFRVQSYGLPLNTEAKAYSRRLLNLPAMQQWYADAVAEPWIEKDHEQACLNYGVVISDKRPAKSPIL